jgi:hypothetical protein
LRFNNVNAVGGRTDWRRVTRVLFGCGTLVASAAACALDWDPQTARRYEGEFAADCHSPGAARLRVTYEAMELRRGSRSIKGRPLMLDLTFLGPSPPTNFDAALHAETPDRRELVLLVYLDRKGRHLEFVPDPSLLVELGLPTPDRTRYRDCDVARAARDGADWLEAQRRGLAAQREAAAADPLNDARFRRAFRRALAPRLGEPWLAERSGPSRGPETVNIAGVSYIQYAFCKPHDCFDNNVLLLYAKAAGLVYAIVFENGGSETLFGSPPPAIAEELRRRWRVEFRQGK